MDVQPVSLLPDILFLGVQFAGDLFVRKAHYLGLEQNVLGNGVKFEDAQKFFEGLQFLQLVLEPGVEGILVMVLERRFQRAHGLEVGLLEGLADGHHFAHGVHLRTELGVGAGEFLEGEARDLYDAVV